MTSRERVLKAFEHKEPDKVPFDFGATRSGGIGAIAYNDLKKHLGVEGERTRIYDIQQQLAWPEDWLLDRYGADVIDAGRAFLGHEGEWVAFRLGDGSQGYVPKYHRTESDAEGNVFLFTSKGTKVAVKPSSSLYFNQCHWPWKDLDAIPAEISKSDFEEQIWDVPSSPYQFDIMRNQEDREKFAAGLRSFYQGTDRAVLLDFGIGGLFEGPGYMRGLENWFCDFMVDEEGTNRLLEKYVERSLDRLEVILTSVGEHIDVLRLFWDDLGAQSQPQLSPDVFRKLFAPRYRILTDYIRKKSRCKILFHSCGSIRELIPQIIESGFDALNPVQTSCVDMDPLTLKREFGKDLVFWGGGCDTVSYLSCKTPAEIQDHVRERIEIFGRDGGFVFTVTHNIQPGVAPANIVAMFEAVNKYR